LTVFDDRLREAIRRGRPREEIEEAARACGTPSLRDDGLRKAAEGVTTVEEVSEETGWE
jgi:type IV pilus assembly protein PilB